MKEEPISTPIGKMAYEICKALSEPEFMNVCLVIRGIGAEKARELFQKTLEIQNGGGIFLESRNRYRSPGGVFFWLAKTEYGYNRPRSGPKKQQRLYWIDRVLYSSNGDFGRIKSMEIKVTGRPGQVINKGDYYQIFMSQKDASQQGLPKGLPIPPGEPIKCVLYIASKKWREVAASLYEDDNALMVAKGIYYPDYETKQTAVFVKEIIVAVKQPKQGGE